MASTIVATTLTSLSRICVRVSNLAFVGPIFDNILRKSYLLLDETTSTVFGVDMTWFVLIVVGVLLVLSAIIVAIAICVCRRQDENVASQNTALQCKLHLLLNYFPAYHLIILFIIGVLQCIIMQRRMDLRSICITMALAWAWAWA